MIPHTRGRRSPSRGCPDWCAGGHHCTARLGTGSHASVPEVFPTDLGRVVATRYLHTSGGHVEIRIIVPLPEGEAEAVGFMRALVAAAHQGIARVCGALGRTGRV